MIHLTPLLQQLITNSSGLSDMSLQLGVQDEMLSHRLFQVTNPTAEVTKPGKPRSRDQFGTQARCS
jgi:hypothetical protein